MAKKLARLLIVALVLAVPVQVADALAGPLLALEHHLPAHDGGTGGAHWEAAEPSCADVSIAVTSGTAPLRVPRGPATGAPQLAAPGGIPDQPYRPPLAL